MPPRFLTFAILLFWALVSSVFVVGDLLPRLRPPEPTFFAIQLIDEAGQQNEVVGWTVERNGAPCYVAQTDWQYLPDDDSFKATCTLWRKEEEPPGRPAGSWPPEFQDLRIEHEFRVRRDERVEQYKTRVSFAPPGLLNRGREARVEVIHNGTEATGRIAPEANATFPLLTAREDEREVDQVPVAAEPFPLSQQGNILQALYPPRRLSGLRAGQRWRLPVLDPYALAPLASAVGDRWPEAARAAVSNQMVYQLDAEVLSEPEAISWEDTQVICRPIVCRGEGTPISSLTLWVREADGVVFRQQVSLWGDEWLFVRRKIPYYVAGARRRPGGFPGFDPVLPNPKSGRLP